MAFPFSQLTAQAQNESLTISDSPDCIDADESHEYARTIEACEKTVREAAHDFSRLVRPTEKRLAALTGASSASAAADAEMHVAVERAREHDVASVNAHMTNAHTLFNTSATYGDWLASNSESKVDRERFRRGAALDRKRAAEIARALKGIHG